LSTQHLYTPQRDFFKLRSFCDAPFSSSKKKSHVIECKYDDVWDVSRVSNKPIVRK